MSCIACHPFRISKLPHFYSRITFNTLIHSSLHRDRRVSYLGFFVTANASKLTSAFWLNENVRLRAPFLATANQSKFLFARLAYENVRLRAHFLATAMRSELPYARLAYENVLFRSLQLFCKRKELILHGQTFPFFLQAMEKISL